MQIVNELCILAFCGRGGGGCKDGGYIICHIISMGKVYVYLRGWWERRVWLSLSLHSRCYVVAFFRQANGTAKWTRSARHGQGGEGEGKNSSYCVCLVIHAGNALSFACQKNAKKWRLSFRLGIAVQFFAFTFLYLFLKTKCSFLLSTTV